MFFDLGFLFWAWQDFSCRRDIKLFVKFAKGRSPLRNFSLSKKAATKECLNVFKAKSVAEDAAEDLVTIVNPVLLFNYFCLILRAIYYVFSC